MRLLALLVPAALMAGDRFEFDDAVRHIEARLDTERTRIPFLGFASGLAGFFAAPFGAQSFKIAIFDRVDAPPSARRGLFDRAPEGWRTVLRVRQRNGEDVTMICRDEGSWARLMMAVVNRNDAVLMQFKVRPTRLLTLIAEKSRAKHRRD